MLDKVKYWQWHLNIQNLKVVVFRNHFSKNYCMVSGIVVEYSYLSINYHSTLQVMTVNGLSNCIDINIIGRGINFCVGKDIGLIN